ncbi:MAG: hypothetical protein ACKO6N_27760 [Myxococcota bacterium]
MGYTLADFEREVVKPRVLQLIQKYPEEFLGQLPPEERVKGLPAEDRVRGLTRAQLEALLKNMPE